MKVTGNNPPLAHTIDKAKTTEKTADKSSVQKGDIDSARLHLRPQRCGQR